MVNALSCFGQQTLENNHPYCIWQTIHSSGIITDPNNPNEHQHFEEDRLEIDDYAFIKSLSYAEKVIIAHYSALIRNWDKDELIESGVAYYCCWNVGMSV
ncbi:MAG: hypothetical protein LBT48_01685 [Prevotellaceae bacterium]|jgi:hypothetical protein|nr:hypothetical protein [Prevotellaceae bacterium]